jgi:hypothetical protein
MKIAPIIGLLMALAVMTGNVDKRDEKGFVVLELFTSEGCSSCPPADELLAKIQKESHGKPVYALAYHVDYWDRLGWKDLYSNSQFSKRQMQYENWLHLSSLYTPQLIINGKSAFVGSDESAIRKAISKQLASNEAASLTLQVQQDGDRLDIKYQAIKTAKNSLLVIALLQKKADSKVERGENAGRTLSHVQIVRKFQTEPVKLSESGTSTIGLPKDLSGQNWEIVGFIQDAGNGEILAAARANLK